MSESTNSLTVSGLTCHYKSKDSPALIDINFSLEMGSTVALLGPNGAGKSTLMKAIYGALEPSAGEIRVMGKPLATYAEPFRIVGFTSDENIYSAKEKVKNLFEFERTAQGLTPEYILNIRRNFCIEEFWDSKLAILSTGQRQRVLIALASLSNPPILLLDEPANGLDIESLEWLYGLIREREKGGQLTIVSSHNLAELKELASKVVIVKQTLRHVGEFFPNSNSFETIRSEYLRLVGNES